MRSLPCRFLLSSVVLLAAGCASLQATSDLGPQPAPEDFLGGNSPKAHLMLLGTFHFSNPGRDSYKPRFVVDILSEERQRELEEVVALLAKYRPTKIAVEFMPERQARVDSLYSEYLAGRHTLGTNEVYQLGFRLARRLGHPKVYLVDAQGLGLPMATDVKARAAELGQVDLLGKSEWDERYKRLYAYDDSLKTVQSLREHLLYINTEDRIRAAHGHYTVGYFKLGAGEDYLGPDLSMQWYNRNLRIFNNVQRLTDSPEERILLIIGSGHVPILRFLAEASPEYRLVEVGEYLGRGDQ